MTTVGIAQLKARFSEYLARVRGGGEVLVTDHGRPVARLIPISGEEGELRELEREGLLRSGPMRVPDGFLEAPRPELSGPGATEALLEERREGP